MHGIYCLCDLQVEAEGPFPATRRHSPQGIGVHAFATLSCLYRREPIALVVRNSTRSSALTLRNGRSPVRTTISAILAIALSATSPCVAQVSPPSGTAGAANAAAASPGGVPSVQGTAPGSTSPGGINGVPQAPQIVSPTANPNQVPNTGPLVNSTTPGAAPSTSAVGGSRNDRGTVGSSAPQQSQRDMDKALDDSTNKKIKDICKGC
jgi:hypothetical protein